MGAPLFLGLDEALRNCCSSLAGSAGYAGEFDLGSQVNSGIADSEAVDGLFEVVIGACCCWHVYCRCCMAYCK